MQKPTVEKVWYQYKCRKCGATFKLHIRDLVDIRMFMGCGACETDDIMPIEKGDFDLGKFVRAVGL